MFRVKHVWRSISWTNLFFSHLASSKSYWKRGNTSRIWTVHRIRMYHRKTTTLEGSVRSFRDKIVVYFCKLNQQKAPTQLFRLISRIRSIIPQRKCISLPFTWVIIRSSTMAREMHPEYQPQSAQRLTPVEVRDCHHLRLQPLILNKRKL